MAELSAAIPVVREAVAAVMRVRMTTPEKVKHGKLRPARFQVALGGTGFCVVADRYLVTAFHVLNGGQPRLQDDQFSAFVVPANGDHAFRFPVVGYPLEDEHADLAVLELGPCDAPGVHIPAVAVSFDAREDGTRVLTVGYPAPEIKGIGLDAQGRIQSGSFFLKSHANEGVVSAHYGVGTIAVYELNVGWHHGESGGPVIDVTEAPRAFSIMQHYRNVQSPHGVVAGPHRGCALSVIRTQLEGLGVVGV